MKLFENIKDWAEIAWIIIKENFFKILGFFVIVIVCVYFSAVHSRNYVQVAKDFDPANPRVQRERMIDILKSIDARLERLEKLENSKFNKIN